MEKLKYKIKPPFSTDINQTINCIFFIFEKRLQLPNIFLGQNVQDFYVKVCLSFQQYFVSTFEQCSVEGEESQVFSQCIHQLYKDRYNILPKVWRIGLFNPDFFKAQWAGLALFRIWISFLPFLEKLAIFEFKIRSFLINNILWKY